MRSLAQQTSPSLPSSSLLQPSSPTKLRRPLRRLRRVRRSRQSCTRSQPDWVSYTGRYQSSNLVLSRLRLQRLNRLREPDHRSVAGNAAGPGERRAGGLHCCWSFAAKLPASRPHRRHHPDLRARTAIDLPTLLPHCDLRSAVIRRASGACCPPPRRSLRHSCREPTRSAGYKRDWTGFYGVGGGGDIVLTKHIGLRAQLDAVHDHPFNDILANGRWTYRFAVGPSFHLGRNVAGEKSPRTP